MGSRVRILLLHIFHFVMMDFLFPLLKNSKSGVDDRGHHFGSGSPLTNYPHALPRMHLAVSFMAWFLLCTCFILFFLLPKEAVTI